MSWLISKQYAMPDHGTRKVRYANKKELVMRISSKGHGAPIDEGNPVDATTGNGITEQQHTVPVCENTEQHP